MIDPDGLAFSAVVHRPGFELEVELFAAPGDVVAVLGPNGAGKSTLLAGLAGLIPLTHGRVTLNQRVLTDTVTGVHVPTHERRIGYVFQDYRLFPHLNVRDNVAFASHAKGASKVDARRVADGWLQRLELNDLATRRPAQLSGGECQRVAVARALATAPELLLLDEPLAALDARTSAIVREELLSLLSEFGGPAVLVTHDPIEAMTMAKRVLILEAGRVVQSGTPRDIAARPATDYVAKLVGLNLLRGRREGDCVRLTTGGTVHVLPGAPGDVLIAMRPSSVVVGRQEGATSARNSWSATVRGIAMLGDRVRLDLSGEPDLLADITIDSFTELQLRPGMNVWISVKATDLEVY